jgi:hypothetical protein
MEKGMLEDQKKDGLTKTGLTDMKQANESNP